mmetsp:Transcript_38933/g.49698  ORF Transcript_38933/g.49698 Transcript_38933/m.49698 type:complete len:190 (+) Transcript_38933:108-677(+)
MQSNISMRPLIISTLLFICCFPNVSSFSLIGTPGHSSHHLTQRSSLRPVWSALGATVEQQAPKNPTRRRSKKVETVVTKINETNGGYLVDFFVKNFNKETKHTMVLSKQQCHEFITKSGKEKEDISTEDIVKYVVKFMQEKGVKFENTEGMIDGGDFPINYFSLRQVQYFHEDFSDTIVKMIAESPEEI